MAEYKFTVDGEEHRVDTDPPGCLDKIVGIFILFVIICVIASSCG